MPATSLAAYFTAPYWSNFANIIGDAVEVTGISIDNENAELQLGEQLQLTATVTPLNASIRNVLWQSTDETVATVEDGKVTAVGYGECDIIASCFGMRVVCHISVSLHIMLDQQEAMLLPNHMLTLTPSATPALPELVVTSSDPTVAAARVMNGRVQIVGIKEGTTTITVNSADGKAHPGTCLVTVYTERGDLNCDGYHTISDVTSLINYLLTDNASNIKIENADLNDNETITISDVTALINLLLTGR